MVQTITTQQQPMPSIDETKETPKVSDPNALPFEFRMHERRVDPMEFGPYEKQLIASNIAKQMAAQGTKQGLFHDTLTSFTTPDQNEYRLSIDSKGAVKLSSHFAGEWGALTPPPVSECELVPAGTKPADALKILEDKLGIPADQAQALYSKMSENRQFSQTLLTNPSKLFDTPAWAPHHPAPAVEHPAEPAPAAAPHLHGHHAHHEGHPAGTHPAAAASDKPQVVLREGESISAIYHTIPKGERPPFEEFKTEFMKANPSITHPDHVQAGKGYALPENHNYEALKHDKRIIDPKVAALAMHAAAGSGVTHNQNEEGPATHGAAKPQQQQGAQR